MRPLISVLFLLLSTIISERCFDVWLRTLTAESLFERIEIFPLPKVRAWMRAI